MKYYRIREVTDMRSMGICLGSTNVSVIIIDKNELGTQIVRQMVTPHNGDVKGIFEDIKNMYDFRYIQRVAVTGRKFRDFINLSNISEPEAIEYAYDYIKEKYNYPNVIVCAGGENFMVYELDQNGKIINVITGNKCASGTGEFYVQQIKRMNLDIETAKEIALIDEPHRVSGRCSVFCKSDCTHALNKGTNKGSVVAGLCQMMANKILELLKKTNKGNVLFIGGTSNNSIMVKYLKKQMPNLFVAKEAEYFEALGTALWALENDTKPIKFNELFMDNKSSFAFLPSLKKFENSVSFKSILKDTVKEGDKCIVGVDVGSTTTKAVLFRTNDNAILASEYLRTNGDPVGAVKQCYKSLYEQTNGKKVGITGVGVTGSGRQIAGLHALTEAVINEIIAHAVAAVYFDPEVDTIFEIGGQDAKYTYITNKVPSDYAMNEACSAGTGSFLEEAARESMGIEVKDIGDLAMQSDKPPNFNDQCAAFISSDIKTAIQEGIKREDIVAGLVYSICQNYSNRVKGNRPIGKKIFMQGGVCYNKAIPIAMAAFTGNEIIVPPEPGLMGAFGVALEVKNRIDLGLLQSKEYDLAELSERELKYSDGFICSGGSEKCDRKCKINTVIINDKKYPFGGACNKYYNLQRNASHDCEELDLVMLREKLVFEKYADPKHNKPGAKRIGIPKSLMVNTLYPLYYNFFTTLGFNIVLGDKVDNEGLEKKSAPFCYPVELSHGYVGNLLKEQVDYIFLPQVIGMHVENGIKASVVCPLAQAEPYYIKSTFKDIKVIKPVLNFSSGYDTMLKEFISIGQELGCSKGDCTNAYARAVDIQKSLIREMKQIGSNVLARLKRDNKIGLVLFGRPYNAFAKSANLGIPHKFASRGYTIIPFDFLPFDDLMPIDRMYWSMGQSILKSANYAARDNSLFGVFITNFSCGPDSFVVNYFRDIMGQKPSLTLELDSHTADAGIDTRIEAFLDIVNSYLQIKEKGNKKPAKGIKTAYTTLKRKELYVINSKGKEYPITDKRVHLLIPSMGDIGSKCMAASFSYSGVNATCIKPYSEDDLKVGRANASCKECLPLMLTVGGLLNYIKSRTDNDELLVYFMPETCGPCRFGQYNVAIKKVLQKNNIENVAVFSLNSENAYDGMNINFKMRAWRALIISDTLQEIYSSILVLSKDREKALQIYVEVCDEIIDSIEKDSWQNLQKVLRMCSIKLSKIPLKGTLERSKSVGLVGEIFVRHDFFSSNYLVEKLAQKGIRVQIAPMAEWIYYCDYRIKMGVSHIDKSLRERVSISLEGLFKRKNERIIKTIMAESGLYKYSLVNVEKIINNVEELISPKLTGEAIMTTGLALTEIIDDVCGIISIGPFGCMPSRIAEAVISNSINTQKAKISQDDIVKKILLQYPNLPFLSIETDGNPYPPIIQSKFESFCLQVNRVYRSIQTLKDEQSS